MIKRILSIDFDYFLKITKEAVRSFPDGVDCSTELSTLIWASYYLGGTQANLVRSVGILEEELECLKRILKKQSPDTPVMIANSHVHVYDFVHDYVSEDEKLSLVNIDMHHDFTNNNKHLDCGNWISYLLDEYKMKLRWIANPISIEMFGLDKEVKEDKALRNVLSLNLATLEEKEEKYDGIFLCRSDMWTPPHLDSVFHSLCDTIADHFNSVVMEQDIRKCRDYESVIGKLQPAYSKYQSEME